MNMNRKIIFWCTGLLALLLVLSIGGACYFYLIKGPSEAYPAGKGPAVVLTEESDTYASAQKFQKEGKHELALATYQEALAGAKDSPQRAQILFNIAYENEQLGKYAEAIAQFKAITADTANYPIARAASLQDVGLMYYTYSGSTTLRTIVKETFKDSPYNSFIGEGSSLNRAYIKLFEHAVSIYPLAGSEVRIAYGYSNEILGTLHGATTTPQGKAYLALVIQALGATKADLERMKKVAVERELIPEILVRAGSTVDNLVTLGVVTDPQLAEPYFKEGIEYASTIGAKPGSFHALNYALFLANRYGDARSEDIKRLLAPFRSNNEKEIYSVVPDYLRAVHANKPTTKRRRGIAALGEMDSGFRGYLLSLGWKPSDFR